METTKHPYEMLVRWDQSGKLTGAQMQYRYVIRDGKKIVGESVGNAEPLAIDKGFPLQDVLTQSQADALATAEAAKLHAAEMERQAQEARTQRDDIKARLSEEIGRLKRQIEDTRAADNDKTRAEMIKARRAAMESHLAARRDAAADIRRIARD